MFSSHFSGVAVDDDLEALAAVGVGDEPDGNEDVLECATLIVG